MKNNWEAGKVITIKELGDTALTKYNNLYSSVCWDSGSGKKSSLKKEITAPAASVEKFKKTLAAKKKVPALPFSEDSGKKKHTGPTDPNWPFNNSKITVGSRKTALNCMHARSVELRKARR